MSSTSFMDSLQLRIIAKFGSVYVVAPHLKRAFFSTLECIAQGREIRLLPVDDRDWEETHKALIEGSEDGSIVVLTGDTIFPYSLAHISYAFNKDEVLIKYDGADYHYDRASGFVLICWMTPQAWLSIDPRLRDDLIRVTFGGIECYLESLSQRQHISVLEKKRWIAAADPVQALKQANSLEERHALLVELFPLDQSEGTFEGFDRRLIKIIEELTDEDAVETQEDLLEVFAIHNDFYLAAEALRREWHYREETLDILANGMIRAEHKGGQSQYYWDLMQELIERGQPRIRKLMEDLLLGGPLEVENALHVLLEVRLWPQVVELIVRLTERSTELAVLDLCRQNLRNLQCHGLIEVLSPVLLDKIYGKDMTVPRVCGLAVDHYQYYLEVGLGFLIVERKLHIEPELRKLAHFQAQILTLEVSAYPKSIWTFKRSVEDLIRTSKWFRAVEHNHLMSVSPESKEYTLMKNAIMDLLT